MQNAQKKKCVHRRSRIVWANPKTFKFNGISLTLLNDVTFGFIINPQLSLFMGEQITQPKKPCHVVLLSQELLFLHVVLLLPTRQTFSQFACFSLVL